MNQQTQQVIEHLKANPDDLGLSVRELGEKLGVGKTIAAEAKSAVKSGMNGHSELQEST